MPLAPCILATVVLNGLATGHDPIPLIRPGPDSSCGALVNISCGARPDDPLDPGRPTVVVIHGLNPFHPLGHFEVGQRYGEALRGRYGAEINIAYWDWNAATGYGLCPRLTQRRALEQGWRLARCLLESGIQPSTLYLIGQSAGCMVATYTARLMTNTTGCMVGRLTIIDPARPEHPLIFDRLGAGTAAVVVEHYWVPGPSGFGRPAHDPNVREVAVVGPSGWYGLVRPSRSDHLNAVRWHIRSIAGR